MLAEVAPTDGDELGLGEGEVDGVEVGDGLAVGLADGDGLVESPRAAA
jgi:hypothetical protein